MTRDRLRILAAGNGVEQIEAAFAGEGFSPHRHDTYAIGLTLSGVQTFHYRGEARASVPGNVIVLHPDELHDGAAGTAAGLVYRMVYISPEKIAAALENRIGLPFVAIPVVDDAFFGARLAAALQDFDLDGAALALDHLVAVAADGLARHADDRTGGRELKISTAVAQCRAFLAAECHREVQSEELEALASMDRFALARQFRQAYGTSPHRYLVMRRLDRARLAILEGEGLADAAHGAGFADQAHFTRHFKRAYGMTPGRWRELVRNR